MQGRDALIFFHTQLLTISLKRIYQYILLVSVMVMSCQSIAMARSDNALEYTVPVIRGLEQYIGMLEYPPYLALAIDNSGIRVGSGGLVVVDKHTLRVNYLSLNFVKKDGQVFTYDIEPAFGISLDSVGLNLKVEIDTSPLRNGFVTLRIHMFNISFFLSSVKYMIDYKIQLANEDNQKIILKYLDGLKGVDSPHISIDAIINQIAMQSNNLRALDRRKTFEVKQPVRRFSPFWHVLFILIGSVLIVIIPFISLSQKRTIIRS